MQLFICEQCGNAISGHKAQGDHFCSDCQSFDEKREEFVCDRCQKIFPLKQLRKGDAVLIPGDGKETHYILCKKCKIVSRSRTNEMSDLKYMVGIFLICFMIPLSIGIIMALSKIPQNLRKSISGQNISSSKWDDLQGEIGALRQEIEYLAKKKENTFPNTGKRILPERSIEDLKRQIALLQEKLVKKQDISTLKQKAHQKRNNIYAQEKKDTERRESLRKLIRRIEEKAISQQVAHLKSGTPIQKLNAILKIAEYREKASAPYLMEALKSKMPLIRALSAKSLAYLGIHSSVSKLVSVLSDKEHFVRIAISGALETLTQEKFIFFRDIPEEKWQKLKLFKERHQNGSNGKE